MIVPLFDTYHPTRSSRLPCDAIMRIWMGRYDRQELALWEIAEELGTTTYTLKKRFGKLKKMSAGKNNA